MLISFLYQLLDIKTSQCGKLIIAFINSMYFQIEYILPFLLDTQPSQIFGTEYRHSQTYEISDLCSSKNSLRNSNNII